MSSRHGLSKVITRSLSFVTFSTAINFFSVLILMPLIITDLTSEKETEFYLALLTLGLSQALDAVRYPLISVFSESKDDSISEYVNQCIYFVSLFCLVLSILSVFGYYFYDLTFWVIPVFTLIGFTSIFWAVLDKYYISGFGHLVRNLSIFIFFFLFYLLQDVNPFHLMNVSLLVNLIIVASIAIHKKKIKICVQCKDKSVILRSRIYATLVHYVVSVIQSNGERIILIGSAREIFNAVSFFSEIANKLSFIPRAIYSAVFPVFSGNKMIIKIRASLIFSIVILSLMVSSYFVMNYYLIDTILVSFIPEKYHQFKEIFIVLVSLSFLKILSYYSVFVLNVSGDFHTQIIVNIFCLIPIILSFFVNVIDMSVLCGIIFAIKSTDIALFVVANIKKHHE